MKYLLRLGCIVAMTLVFNNVSFSQAAVEVAAAKTEKMAKSLDLSPEQTADVQKLNVQFSEKEKAIASGTPNAEEATGKLKELKVSFIKELSAILTAEQLEKFKAMQPQRKE